MNLNGRYDDIYPKTALGKMLNYQEYQIMVHLLHGGGAGASIQIPGFSGHLFQNL